MTITRFLLPGCVLVACACPALAQPGGPGSRYDLIPSVRPVGAEETDYPDRPQVPTLPPPQPAVTGLDQFTGPGRPGAPGYPPSDPVGTLTGQPQQPGYPPGSYPSPYYVDGPGCCGPLERDGRIGYEVYTFTGMNFVFGPGLAEHLHLGWNIGGSVRTLYFDRSHTAAWTIDLGGSYTHNSATGGHEPVNLFIRTPPVTNQQAGTVTLQPDRFVLSGISGIHRSSFNYSFGRDVWLWGTGNTGGMQGPNLRVGGWIGGRYGTASINVVPMDVPNGYARRQSVFESITIGAHASYEVPMGAWILFGGVRAEYGYDWMNLAPPLIGDMHNINFQFSVGVRY